MPTTQKLKEEEIAGKLIHESNNLLKEIANKDTKKNITDSNKLLALLKCIEKQVV